MQRIVVYVRIIPLDRLTRINYIRPRGHHTNAVAFYFRRQQTARQCCQHHHHQTHTGTNTNTLTVGYLMRSAQPYKCAEWVQQQLQRAHKHSDARETTSLFKNDVVISGCKLCDVFANGFVSCAIKTWQLPSPSQCAISSVAGWNREQPHLRCYRSHISMHSTYARVIAVILGVYYWVLCS